MGYPNIKTTRWIYSVKKEYFLSNCHRSECVVKMANTMFGIAGIIPNIEKILRTDIKIFERKGKGATDNR